MDIETLLQRQRQLYTSGLPAAAPPIAIHPVSGQWQETEFLRSQFWWGGGLTHQAWMQLQSLSTTTNLTNVAVLTFGPVQSFLGAGQRLRDWAVASWLCHYLSAVLIYRWEKTGGKVLLPLHQHCQLLRWLKGEEEITSEFWQAELPNTITALYPNDEGWIEEARRIVQQEWSELVAKMEAVAIRYNSSLLNGVGWQVIRRDHACLWSSYAVGAEFETTGIRQTVQSLHRELESQKLGRDWQGPWWGGRTSPTAGALSTWHQGLKPVDRGGIWGIPGEQLSQWWERAASGSRLSGLFSSDERLNSIELIKRLASVPEIIEPVLRELWPEKTLLPACPWRIFPDRTAVAAAWVPTVVPAERWNEQLSQLYGLRDLHDEEDFIFNWRSNPWGIPAVDATPGHDHPRILERQTIRDIGNEEILELWEEECPSGWESPIEWVTGWRGDGDKMGEWLAGKQYANLKLDWERWHPSRKQIEEFNLDVDAPQVPQGPRQIELPHMLDLSVLFGYWNQLLTRLAEEHHQGKVIFAGGDDFLLLGPLTEMVPLTTNLYHLWRGEETPLTHPRGADGWVSYDGSIFPVPGQKMDFSLGVVVAQRRVPQSLWHRGLNQAYKEAKNAGRNRVCVQVLFNSGQSLSWCCPWSLWPLMMGVQPNQSDRTELNRWDKLLGYLESSRLLNTEKVGEAQALLETLWQSIGIPLRWDDLNAASTRDIRQSCLESWQWWLAWVSIRSFLARQERERAKWLERIS